MAVSSASMMLFAFSDPSDPALKRVAAFFTSANASMMPAGWVLENSGRLTRIGREAGANASAPESTRRSVDRILIFPSAVKRFTSWVDQDLHRSRPNNASSEKSSSFSDS